MNEPRDKRFSIFVPFVSFCGNESGFAISAISAVNDFVCLAWFAV
jgi:hypothetical protein